MSPKTLAAKLLQFSSTTSLMVPGALTAEIGNEALREALNLGWLRPSEDTGLLMLTDQQSQLHEMRALAEAPEQEAVAQPQAESASRAFAMNHSSRLREAFGTGLFNGQSGGAPGSGQPERGITGPTPPLQMNRTGSEYNVGEDVIVAEEGKSYQAKVQSKNPDGTYKLTFGPNRPTKQDRMFRREEMQRITPEQNGVVKVEQ